MKIIKLSIVILLLQLLCLRQSISEQNTWYIGSKIGLPQYNHIVSYINKLIICNKINDSIHNSHLGFGSFIGYQNNQHFSFELAYNWLGKIIYSNNEINSIFKVQNIDLSAKLHHPIINNNTFLYTRFGAAIWNANVKNIYFNNENTYSVHISDTSLSPLLSFGIEHKIQKHWTTRLEYQRINNIGNINTIGAQSNNTMLNLNILYYFTQ